MTISDHSLAVWCAFVHSQENSACKWVSELPTCSWIDYNSWHPGQDPKAADAAIRKVIDGIEDEDCKWAYTGIIALYVWFSDLKFSLFLCKGVPQMQRKQGWTSSSVQRHMWSINPSVNVLKWVQELLEKCPDKYWNGVTETICSMLPETDCTSDAGTIAPGGIGTVDDADSSV